MRMFRNERKTVNGDNEALSGETIIIKTDTLIKITSILEEGNPHLLFDVFFFISLH